MVSRLRMYYLSLVPILLLAMACDSYSPFQSIIDKSKEPTLTLPPHPDHPEENTNPEQEEEPIDNPASEEMLDPIEPENTTPDLAQSFGLLLSAEVQYSPDFFLHIGVFNPDIPMIMNLPESVPVVSGKGKHPSYIWIDDIICRYDLYKQKKPKKIKHSKNTTDDRFSEDDGSSDDQQSSDDEYNNNSFAEYDTSNEDGHSSDGSNDDPSSTGQFFIFSMCVDFDQNILDIIPGDQIVINQQIILTVGNGYKNKGPTVIEITLSLTPFLL